MNSPTRADFEALIADVAATLSRHDIPFMVIGGQAVLLHGEPRLTQDIDITLGVGPTRGAQVMDLCRDMGLELLPEDAEEFLGRTLVLPVAQPDTVVRVDFIFSTTPYERQAIDRCVHVDMRGVRVPFASPEDLILHKLFAGRARDLEDAAGVVRRKGPELDWDYMEEWAEEFARLPEGDALARRLRELARLRR